jgi:hypothetical protein
MQSSRLSTKPKTKDWQDAVALHLVWHAAAVVIVVKLASGVWLPLPAGTIPQVLLPKIGEAETPAMKTDAARTPVSDCMLIIRGAKSDEVL